MKEELTTAYTTKQKAEVMLSNLEKLRASVSLTEAKYTTLQADYTRICDDAISRISALKNDLEDEPAARDVARTTKGLQAIVNRTADCIELGFDTIGDGIIFAIGKMVDTCTSIPGILNQKMRRQHRL